MKASGKYKIGEMAIVIDKKVYHFPENDGMIIENWEIISSICEIVELHLLFDSTYGYAIKCENKLNGRNRLANLNVHEKQLEKLSKLGETLYG